MARSEHLNSLILFQFKARPHHSFLTSLHSASPVCFIPHPASTSNYAEYYLHPSATHWTPCRGCQISIWGKHCKTGETEASSALCRRSRLDSSLVWLILPPAPHSSLVIPLQHFGRAPHKWQVCSHGNRPVMPLSPLACQMKSCSGREEAAGDLSDLTSVQQCDFWQQVASKSASERCHC